MKAFIIAAGLLMGGASVYGVVDYNKRAKSQEFKELYKEKPSPVNADAVKEDVSTPVVEKNDSSEVNTEVPTLKDVTNKKKALKKKEEERVFHVREFSRGKLG